MRPSVDACTTPERDGETVQRRAHARDRRPSRRASIAASTSLSDGRVCRATPQWLEPAGDDAGDEQAPLVPATALTTAAGFGALVTCGFEGLRDIEMVGVAGAPFGLVTALVVVPAGVRLSR